MSWSPRTRRARLLEVECLVKSGKVKPEVLEKLQQEHPDYRRFSKNNSRVKNEKLLVAALQQSKSQSSIPVVAVSQFADETLAALSDGSLDDDLARFQRDPLVKEALEKEVDLREYAEKTGKELSVLEAASVDEYLSPEVLESVTAIHSRLAKADKMLAHAQTMIRGFQEDLGDVSTEMRELHSKCTLLDTKRKNRVALEEKLKEFLGRVAVPSTMKPILNRNVHEGVDDEFLRTVQSLNEKIKFVRSAAEQEAVGGKGVSPASTTAVKNVAPQLEELRMLAVRNIQAYLISQCTALRKCSSNALKVQRIQRDKMQRFAYFTRFLEEHSSRATMEVEEAYINAMRRVFQQVLSDYHRALQKYQAPQVDRTMLIAVPDAGRRGLFTTKVSLEKKATDFNVDQRQATLQNMGQHGDWLDPIALKRSQRAADMPYELIFRSLLKRLMELVTFEFLFLEHFFPENETLLEDREEKANAANVLSRQRRIFEKCIELAMSEIISQVKASINQSWDAVGLLLLVQLVHSAQSTVTDQVPELAVCMKRFWSELLTLFWVRFENIIADNVKSMQEARADRLGPVSKTSHVTSRRFSALVSAMWTVGGFFDNDTNTVASAIARLSKGIQLLLIRLAELHKNRRDRSIFLANNYDQMLTAFSERRSSFMEVSEFRNLLEKQIFIFTDELLREDFEGLMTFAQSRNRNMDDKAQLESLVTSFAANYKSSIRRMDSVVIQSFNNAQLANAILKRAFSQLLTYYNNFHGAIKSKWPDGSSGRPLWLRSLVGTGSIMVELKRYSRSL
eukprot:g1457.t1